MNEASVVQWLNKETANRSTDSTACHVTMFNGYDPTAGSVDVRFRDGKDRTGNHLRMQTLLPLDKQRGQIVNYVELVCSTYELCDRDFLGRWARWLAKLNYDKNQDALIEILASDGNSSKCDASNQSVSCSSGMFVTVYTAPGIKNANRSRCTENKISELEVKWEADELQSPRFYEIEHTNRQDQCISEDVLHRLWQESLKMYDHFNLIAHWSLRMKKLNVTFNPQSEQVRTTSTAGYRENDPRSGKPQTTSTIASRKSTTPVKKVRETSTVGQYKSQDAVSTSDLYKWVFIAWLAAVVPFSVVALIWYYCRSRRNRRGYQAASTTQ